MDLPVEQLMHWVPTPLLALGFWALMKKAFNDHETRFAGLVKRFEDAVATMQAHDTALALLKNSVERAEKELGQQREKVHHLINELYVLKGRLMLADDGGKRSPRGNE